MARENGKAVSRGRADELKRELKPRLIDYRRVIRSRNFALAMVIWAGFAACAGSLALWARSNPLVAVGRVVDETRTVRVEFAVEDSVATEQARAAARLRVPRVYSGDVSVFDQIRGSLVNLPGALRDVESLEAVDLQLREQFGLTDEHLRAVRGQVAEDGRISGAWLSRVGVFDEALRRLPLVDAKTFQVERVSPNKEVELRLTGAGEGSVAVLRVGASEVTNAEKPELAEDLRRLAARCGLSGLLQDVVVSRVLWNFAPTYVYDAVGTLALQDAAAAKVEPVVAKYPDREVIYRRGDTISASQLEVLRAAIAAEERAATAAQRWAPRAGVVVVVTAVSAGFAGYVALFCGRIRRNPARMLALAGLLAAMLGAACLATVAEPGLTALTATAPTLFLTLITIIAYDQRTAIAVGFLHAVLVAVALDLPAGSLAALVCGVGAAAWTLRELRDRDALIRVGVVLGCVMAATTLTANLLQLPITGAAARQALWDAGLAAAAGLLVAGVTLFVLPLLERAFDIITGMTLVELRDPKQPLLRRLQQAAPGTYNHSLNLGSLAEAAAEEIGADGLLAYVGALYHDIGKMNKPEYFVENQTPGFNRHDKLSPAMSLLVIVGHVKDGMELAREFGLPRPLHHFIESHHGTTLVEYFYHRARKQAEAAALAGAGFGSAGGAGGTGGVPGAPEALAAANVQMPSELEYRYPGPRPRTKEAAIVMLCDAVESAARAMTEPTPARIDATVRAIASKRLMDGQFDECEITLREINTVVDTVSRTLASIYHGRIAYPTLGGPAPAPSASSAGGVLPATMGGSAGGNAESGSGSRQALAGLTTRIGAR